MNIGYLDPESMPARASGSTGLGAIVGDLLGTWSSRGGWGATVDTERHILGRGE